MGDQPEIDLFQAILENLPNMVHGRPEFAKEEKTFERIFYRVDRISKIVSSLRTLARADREAARQIDVVATVTQAVDMLSEIYKNDGIKLTLEVPDTPVFMNGIEGRLQQAIINLLSNAEDATLNQDNPKILLRVREEKERAIIEVIDNGPGIPDKIAQRIFDSFFTTKEVGQGTGIGLSITESIVKGFGGDINFETALGKGTVFRINLPTIDAFRDQTASKPVSANPETIHYGARVLLVDDEYSVREVLRFMLEDCNCSVVEAHDGQEALELFQEGAYDVVITDLKMPRMNGITLIQKIREIDDGKTKVVAITGGFTEDFDDAAKGVLESMTNQVLHKPFGISVIKDLLQAVTKN